MAVVSATSAMSFSCLGVVVRSLASSHQAGCIAALF
jgi:hypothetical protein